MQTAGKYIFAGALFLRILFAANVPVAGPIQSFDAYRPFTDFYSSDGGHKLARSASGKLHAVFADKQDNHYKIIRAYSSNSGANFTTAIITETSYLHTPALAVSGEDVYVVYTEENSIDGGVSIVKYTGDGAALQSARVVTDATNTFIYTDIALDKAGYIYVAVTFLFPQNRKVRIFRSNSPGDISGFTEEKCNGSDFNELLAFFPKLAVDVSDGVYLAYELRSTTASDSPKQIAIHKRINIAGGSWTNAEKISPNFRAQHPDIVFRNGQLHLVYSEQPNNINDDCNLHYRIYSENLEMQSDDIILSAQKIYSPRLSFSGDTPLIQYVGSADGSTYHVKMTAKNASGVWETPRNLSDAPNAVYAHNVVEVVNDSPDVFWYNTSDQKVYFAARADMPDMIAPNNCGVTINNGETLTKNPTLQLTLFATDTGSGLASMNISETNSLSANWLPYGTSSTYTLQDTTVGNKTIYVWYRDKAGNISAATTATILLTDAGGSGGSVKINNDAPYTNTRNVTLTFSNNHALAYDMRVSDDATSKWVSVNATLKWTLSSGDGTKTVFVEYRNAAGNVTWNGTSDSILLDTTAPSDCGITINNGETLTKNPVLRLTLTATDAGSGLASMNISETGSPNANWLPYGTNNTYTLQDTTVGNKTIYVWYRDKAGNISAATTATILLTDAGGTGGTVEISGNVPYTNTRNVTLTFSNNHALAYDMRVSDDATSKWVSVNTTLAWTLSSGDGTKTVFVEYRNAAGNVTWNGTGDSILLDTTAPSDCGITINNGETLTKNPTLQLTLFATDTGSGLASMNISETGSPSANWLPYGTNDTYTLQNTATGNKTISVWYQDKAGNISAATTATILLTDTGGSGGTVKINNDAPYTNTRNVTLTFSNNHALAYDMRVSDDAMSKWVSVNTTLAWTLSSGDGTKTVSVEYRNAAGNVTWSGTSDDIILDAILPSGSLEINGGETTTNNAILSLKLTASNDTVSMNINEADAWSIWQNYSAQSIYALLNAATGNKTIYVWLKDRAGNTSATISAGIILEAAVSGSAVPEEVVPAAAVPVGKKIYSYPNPAQPRKKDLTIVYSADKDGAVNIYLYNILGERIWSASGYAKVGAKNEVAWNGRDAYGNEAGNGVYILLLTDERKKVLARGRLTILDD